MTSTLNILKNRYRAVLLGAGCALIGLLPGGAQAGDGQHGVDICGQTSKQLLSACKLAVGVDTQVESAKCLNLSDPLASASCISAVEGGRGTAFEECTTVRVARDLVCSKLGNGVYDPVIDPANFVVGITNIYTPFAVGAFRVYEKTTAEGLYRIRVEVLPETREIMGVTVTTLRDTVTLNDVLIEDTKDWLAQDRQGNVWYMGEIVQNFEDGLLANLDGSFEAGKAGAKAGFWSTGAPQVGDFYRQEWALTIAEDVVEVLSLDALDTIVPFSQNGTGPILKVEATTPMSPVVEYKYYVPGIGFALEVKPATGERLELVDYGPR